MLFRSGIFDNVDKLYIQVSGSTAAGGAPPAPPGGGGAPPAPPAGGEAGGPPIPENYKRDNLKILLENDSLTEDDSYIDLSRAKNSLGEMENHLSKLLRD